MSKAKQIMRLYDGKRSTREIAAIVGCRPEYVRVVARQRKGKGASEIDVRYLASAKGQRVVRKMLSYKRAYERALYHAVPKDIRIRTRRKAYGAALKEGHDVATATSLASWAVRKRSVKMGNSDIARAACMASK